MINYGYDGRQKCWFYEIQDISRQSKHPTIIGRNTSLNDLILEFRIHILKGKIIIFEEGEDE